MTLSSSGVCGRAYKSATARTKAAKPAADEARPAAVGKLFSETMRNGQWESLGREGSWFSRVARRERSADKQAVGRAEVRSPGREFRVRVSGGEKVGDVDAVVCVRRSDWERVTLRLELVGRLRVVLRLPQYLVMG